MMAMKRDLETPMDAALIPDDAEAFDQYIEAMRSEQYPMLKDSLNLDYAGSCLPSKRLLDAFHAKLVSNIYGNSHSGSEAGLQSARMIENARTSLLRFFNADPEYFDLIFTANTTAAIKLVGEALRDVPGGFSYGYHIDSHTSLIGLRELATEARCTTSQTSLDIWRKRTSASEVKLFAYPAQSNMTGKRMPLQWCREYNEQGIYVLLDVAAYASTTELNINDIAADFTVVSLYKIFGFPDLGALIVKKSAGHLFKHRRYFGGGTVDLVVCSEDPVHAKKTTTLHDQLEDGTLPIHNIAAIEPALQSFNELLGGLDRVSKHTLRLAKQLHADLAAMRHANGSAVCELYSETADPAYAMSQGPTVAFNLKDDSGAYISTAEVDKLAAVANIQLRTGTLCNPGGMADALQLSAADLRDNYTAGYRCGGSNILMNGRPTGAVRVSLGCISTMSDVLQFSNFMQEHFRSTQTSALYTTPIQTTSDLYVESLTIYPIKSCAGWSVPYDKRWPVNEEGLQWDREWCIVYAGTGKALSQKQHPRMALLKPEIDLNTDCLRIRVPGGGKVEISLNSRDDIHPLEHCAAQVCEDAIYAQRYKSTNVSQALSAFLDVDCHLVRFSLEAVYSRHSKEHLRVDGNPTTLLLSNESPILTITRASLDSVNEALKGSGKRAVHHSAFRANIVLSELPSTRPGTSKPWEEDQWSQLSFRNGENTSCTKLDILGGCRRCQMICVDQQTGQKRPEVFLTLAKKRRIDGRVLFGVHCALSMGSKQILQVGDTVSVT